MKKQILKRVFPWLIAIGLFVWVWLQIPWGEVGEVFRSISLIGLTGLIVLDLIIVLIMSGRWWFVLRGLGVQINYLTASRYRLAATAVSYFTPGPQFGGEPLQVWVLTKYEGVTGETAVASVTIDKLMELIANFAILVFGVLVILQTQATTLQTNRLTLLLIVLLWSVPTALLFRMFHGHQPLSTGLSKLLKLLFNLISFRFKKTAVSMLKTVRSSEKRVHQLRQQAPKQLLFAWLMTCLNWLLWFAEFWLVYYLLGLLLNWNELFFSLTTARIAFLLPSPTGLGTFEASQYVAMTAIGQSVAIGLSATLLMRVRDTLLAGLGLWFARRLIGEN